MLKKLLTVDKAVTLRREIENSVAYVQGEFVQSDGVGTQGGEK